MKLFFSLLFSATFVFSSTAFIKPKELRALIIKQNTILLDTTDKNTFKQGHIPSAINVDAMKFRKQVGLYQLMESSKKIQKLFRSLGVNNNSHVVIYAHTKKKEFLKAGYLALALVVNGFTNVSILDGGYTEWLEEYEDFISMVDKDLKEGNFTAHFNPNILVDLEYVRKSIGEVSMIESRPKRYYDAQAQSKGVRRLGHIPKAKSSFWGNKFESDTMLKADKELENIYISQDKLKQNKEVIVYCTGGLEASINWYILHQHFNFKDVKIYDASMREWGNRDDTPMEK